MNALEGIQIRAGQSASSLFHSVLWQTARSNNALIEHSTISADSKHFKRHYVEMLPRFEAARLHASNRIDIAIQLYRLLLDNIVFTDSSGSRSLAEHLQAVADPVKLMSVSGDRSSHWQFNMAYGGQDWGSLRTLSDLLFSRRVINSEACDALTWLDEQVLSRGRLTLGDRKVVVFGAGAEMASTRLFLGAGADVLWLDRVAPPRDLLSGAYPGSLSWCEQPLDLLLEPEKVLAAVLAFGAGKPLDLCLYAYAPGNARELRLTGAMSALIEALPDSQVRTVTMLVSPTTTACLGAADLQDIEKRKDSAPFWEKSLGSIGLMGKPGVARYQDAAVTRTLVNIQGASYQAAQYLGKLMTAEAWHARGLRVSANTAAITQTRSLDHPVFDAAFGGARALQVETFSPNQSQTINGLLSIRDWLVEERPTPGAIRVHGGIHTLPYPLDKALRIAAAIGFAKSPALLKRLVSRN